MDSANAPTIFDKKTREKASQVLKIHSPGVRSRDSLTGACPGRRVSKRVEPPAEGLSKLFHPAVAAWFEGRFPSPTPAQIEAWPAIIGRPAYADRRADRLRQNLGRVSGGHR